MNPGRDSTPVLAAAIACTISVVLLTGQGSAAKQEVPILSGGEEATTIDPGRGGWPLRGACKESG